MKKIIPFNKEIDFENNIKEVISISLEHNLLSKNNNYISGEISLIGKYKDLINNVHDFNENFNFDLNIDKKYNIDNISIDIDNFYYEINNSKSLNLFIDILVDNLNIKKIIEEEEEEELVEILQDKNINNTKLNSNFSFDEKFCTYKIHIIRNDENLDYILNKYNTNKLELEKYNNLENLKNGCKIIIPVNNV